MTSKDLKALLSGLGIKARVVDLGYKLRVCPSRGSVWKEGQDAVLAALNALVASHGVTNCLGLGFTQVSFNGTYELSVYKPGTVVRVSLAEV